MKDLIALSWTLSPIKHKAAFMCGCHKNTPRSLSDTQIACVPSLLFLHGDKLRCEEKFKSFMKCADHIVWVLIKRTTMQLFLGWRWCCPPTHNHNFLPRCASLSICQLLFLSLPAWWSLLLQTTFNTTSSFQGLRRPYTRQLGGFI